MFFIRLVILDSHPFPFTTRCYIQPVFMIPDDYKDINLQRSPVILMMFLPRTALTRLLLLSFGKVHWKKIFVRNALKVSGSSEDEMPWFLSGHFSSFESVTGINIQKR